MKKITFFLKCCYCLDEVKDNKTTISTCTRTKFPQDFLQSHPFIRFISDQIYYQLFTQFVRKSFLKKCF